MASYDWPPEGSGSTGTVTSVGLADNSTSAIFNVTGSPVTTSGVIDITLITQLENTFLAGPISGSAAQPTFRTIVAADIPDLSATYVTQSEVGADSGVASLNSSGKVPASQLPSTVFEYQGQWNPSTNTPVLSDLTGTNGYVYQVSAAAAGPIAGLSNSTMVNFQIGNLVIYSGSLSQWEQTDYLTGVTSVNGSTGAVTVNAINQLSGDGTTGAASGSQSEALTLATVNVNTGSFGSSSAIPAFTVNGKGLITAASTSSITAPAGGLTGTTLASNVVTSSLTSVGTLGTGVWQASAIASGYGGTGISTASSTGVPTISSGTWSIESQLATSLGGLGGNFGSSSGALSISSGTVSAGTLGTANGGTGTASSGNQYGLPYYSTATAMSSTTAGSAGQVLTSNGTSAPTFQAVPGSAPTYTYSAITSNPAPGLINYWYSLSSTAFTFTLPDATTAGYSGQSIVLEHNGSNFTQYTIDTTSSQTMQVGGVTYTSGNVYLATKGEIYIFRSNGSNWICTNHTCDTTWASDTSSTVQFYTFTISSGSYSGTIGATYTNNSNTYTLCETFTTSATSIVLSGPASPSSTGTLTNASGTHVGNPVFTAFSGAANNPTATTTAPAFYGAPTVNAAYWRRSGPNMIYWLNFYQATAGASAGSGDYIFSLPSGISINTTLAPTYTGGTAQADQAEVPAGVQYFWPATGRYCYASDFITFQSAAPYASGTFRIYGIYGEVSDTVASMGSTFSPASNIMAFNFQVTFPISGWLP